MLIKRNLSAFIIRVLINKADLFKRYKQKYALASIFWTTRYKALKISVLSLQSQPNVTHKIFSRVRPK